jgi:UDP-N-acetylmuramoyl-tripeptide--D-alanyl-D-alanine ligase
MRLTEVLDSTGAVLVRGAAERLVHGVSTDTRSIHPEALYLALRGPNFDGNRFAAEAAGRGAGALILRREDGLDLAGLPDELPVAVHESPLRALADLGAWHRSRLAIPVIAITGSTGKTTTKNIVAQLLGSRMRVVSSPASFNNEIGVPLTILAADAETEVLVVEMGTNAPGELAQLTRIARPTVGVLTNAGASHLEGLGSLEGVMREKSALYAGLATDGVAVLNLDGRFAEELRDVARCRVVTFSVGGEGDLVATDPLFHSGGTSFRLHTGQGLRDVTSPLLGIHNIHNLLAGLAACHGLGVELDELLPAVARLTGGRRRMERRELGELTLFDDTYNSNPESARAAVRVLAGLHAPSRSGEPGRRVLVFGDMLELGESAPEQHHAIGRDAAEAGIDLLALVGDLTRATAAGALEAGVDPERVVHLGTPDEAAAEIAALVHAGDVVLIKGSRRMGLERLVQRIERAHGPADGEGA